MLHDPILSSMEIKHDDDDDDDVDDTFFRNRNNYFYHDNDHDGVHGNPNHLLLVDLFKTKIGRPDWFHLKEIEKLFFKNNFIVEY